MTGSDFILRVRPDKEKLLLPFLDVEKKGLGGLFISIGKALFPSAYAQIILPSAQLSGQLFASFRNWIKEKLPSPSEATLAFMNDYLETISGHTVLSGQRPAAEENPPVGSWSLKVCFDAADGTAEASALLACHWADVWWREKRENIERDILIPCGLLPESSDQSPARYGLFSPAGKLGYALYMPPGSEINGPIGKSSFMLDECLEDNLSQEEAGDLYRRLNSTIPQELTDGKCLCQICAETR